jgi:mycothiol synthase
MSIHHPGNDTFSKGFTIRQATPTDVHGIVEMIRATEFAEAGEAEYTQEDLLEDWGRPGFEPARDAFVAVAGKESRIVGYEEVYNRSDHTRLDGDGYVHPDFVNHGIGTALLRAIQVRAQEHAAIAGPGSPVLLRNGLYGSDWRARELHENEGFCAVRYIWRMRIEMASPPPQPVWPAGVELRGFPENGDVLPVFAALEDAFRDHWGFTPWNFDGWVHRNVNSDGFDPGLWFLAYAQGAGGEEIAGGAHCRMRQETGWVSQLGVRQPWRKNGLGLALLLASFGEFYQRGVHTVDLGVDAENPTGATRLYRRAGMQVAHEYVIYEKDVAATV